MLVSMLDMKSKALGLVKSGYACFVQDCDLYLYEESFHKYTLNSNLEQFIGCINSFWSLGVLSWEDRCVYSKNARELYRKTITILDKEF